MLFCVPINTMRTMRIITVAMKQQLDSAHLDVGGGEGGINA